MATRALTGSERRQECADCGSHTCGLECGNCKGYHLVPLGTRPQTSLKIFTASKWPVRAR